MQGEKREQNVILIYLRSTLTPECIVESRLTWVPDQYRLDGSVYRYEDDPVGDVPRYRSEAKSTKCLDRVSVNPYLRVEINLGMQTDDL